MWTKLEGLINGYLDSVTLEDLLDVPVDQV